MEANANVTVKPPHSLDPQQIFSISGEHVSSLMRPVVQ